MPPDSVPMERLGLDPSPFQLMQPPNPQANHWLLDQLLGLIQLSIQAKILAIGSSKKLTEAIKDILLRFNQKVQAYPWRYCGFCSRPQQ